MSSSPKCLTMADSAAHSLVLLKTAEETNLRGEHLVIGNLVHQLPAWEQKMRILKY